MPLHSSEYTAPSGATRMGSPKLQMYPTQRPNAMPLLVLSVA